MPEAWKAGFVIKFPAERDLREKMNFSFEVEFAPKEKNKKFILTALLGGFRNFLNNR